MVKTILRLAGEHDTLSFVDDQRGHPTFADDLAAMIKRLVVERRPGIFHVTNQGAVSWYEFAREVLDRRRPGPRPGEARRHRRPPAAPPGAAPGQLGARQRRPAAVGRAAARRLPGAAGAPRRAPARRRVRDDGQLGGRTIRLVVLNYNGGDHVAAVPASTSTGSTGRPTSSRSSWSTTPRPTAAPRQIERALPAVGVRSGNDRNGGFPANNLALGDLDGVALRRPGQQRRLRRARLARRRWSTPSTPTRASAPPAPKLLLAPRFADVRDRRPRLPARAAATTATLGVMVRGVTVDGVDVWRDAHLGEGGWGREADGDGHLRVESAPTAVLRVPVARGDAGPVRARRCVLQAREPVTVTVDGGDGPVEVDGRHRPRPRSTVAVVGAALRRGQQRRLAGASTTAPAPTGACSSATRGQYDEPVEVFAWCGGGVLFRPEYLARRRPLRRAVLPLLRGHRPLVAGPGPGLALPHRAHAR